VPWEPQLAAEREAVSTAVLLQGMRTCRNPLWMARGHVASPSPQVASHQGSGIRPHGDLGPGKRRWKRRSDQKAENGGN
jgi:hypothetical protein